MKLSKTQLRSIIKEELDSMTQAPVKKSANKPSPKYQRELSHLSELREMDKRAYKAYVDMLAEDNNDTFWATGDGSFRVDTEDGQTLTWDPENTNGQWELQGEETPDDFVNNMRNKLIGSSGEFDDAGYRKK